MFSKKNNKKGFTLMEMLIVVAIIVILIAIMIPTFNNQLEKSREAADAANIRAAYAEVMVKYLDGAKAQGVEVDLQQATDDWATDGIQANLENLGTVEGTPVAGGTATVTVDADGAATITFSE